MTDQTPIPLPPAARVPAGPVRPGSEAHKALFCTELPRMHDPYRPALINWPALEEETRANIVSLPIQDMAVQSEGRTGLFVKTLGETVRDPLLRAAIDRDAVEEARHKTGLADMVRAYGIALPPEPSYARPRDPEWAFMRSGYPERIGSFFGFGLFRIARDTGFFPPEPIDTVEPAMREEGRHILFFVNGVAWWRRPWFEAKVIAVWAFLISERIDMAKGLGKTSKVRETNFMPNGSKEPGVGISFPEPAAICLAENDRRLAGCEARPIRPRFVPGAIRLALNVMGRCSATA